MLLHFGETLQSVSGHSNHKFRRSSLGRKLTCTRPLPFWGVQLKGSFQPKIYIRYVWYKLDAMCMIK